MLRRQRYNAQSLFLGAASILAISVSTPAFAQDTAAQAVDEEEEIVVTAILRETSLLEVPFSINAQTEEDIQRSAATTIEDLSRNVAGLTIQNLGPGQSQVSVRGVSAGPTAPARPGAREQAAAMSSEPLLWLRL